VGTAGPRLAGCTAGLAVAAAAAVLAGCSLQTAQPLTAGESATAIPSPSSPTPSTAPADPPGSPRVVPSFRSVRRYEAVALPVRLRIPEAGVDTRLIRLGLTSDGWIEAPTQWQVAGWYDGGPRPGQSGPAVIVGHIDSRSGPAVFHDLPVLRLGAEVDVDRADGTTVTFRVAARRQVSKHEFPAGDVYAPTLRPSLVLMTCGGVFDRRSGHYRDNVLVTAVPG